MKRYRGVKKGVKRRKVSREEVSSEGGCQAKESVRLGRVKYLSEGGCQTKVSREEMSRCQVKENVKPRKVLSEGCIR